MNGMYGTLKKLNASKNEIVWERVNGEMTEPYGVDPRCVLTLNGKPAKLSELRSGDKITVDGKPAVSLAATRP